MPRTPKIEGWIRRLEGDRLEILLKVEHLGGVQDRKIRASGPTAEMYELVDWFEGVTGLTVNVPDRLRTGPRPTEGQMTFTMGERPSEEVEGGDHGELSGVRC
jgi:hypothetical protein